MVEPKSGIVRRAAATIRSYPWWAGLAALVGLELAREYLGGRYPLFDDLAKALLVVLESG